MKRFEKTTRIIPTLSAEEKHGFWVVDTVHKGTPDDPVQFPFVGYGRAAHDLMDAVGEIADDLDEEMDVRNYLDVLESYGLFDEDDVKAVDVATCDAKCTLAMIVTIVRQDRFCEGMLLEYLENGKMLEWMKHLEELDGQ